MLVMSRFDFSSDNSNSTMPANYSTDITSTNATYDSLPEPRSIVQSSSSSHIDHQFPWFAPTPPPPPPPPYPIVAAAAAAAACNFPFDANMTSPTESSSLSSPSSFPFSYLPPPPQLLEPLCTSPLSIPERQFKGHRQRERRSRKAAHELLTEAEKKANHIASEQKRRQNIRMGFDSLIEVVPTLSRGNRSEGLILQKSIEHIQHLVTMKHDLKNQVRDLQTILGDPNYEEDSSDDDQFYK
ncbi:uncharacterized protein BX664DRAFT_289283 [Halteromyces radiatus]|uniref:uncharacterized protein n=1 Tax=Halteromyces radiatus TaxID=101107 RepID=UPI0022210BB2|nr:uncharacterized protein BX664DRAFT_289283 [Halteromyces radiatus]KAI8099268.1 hypothetical protein BX664DRAFT_289283 [Halteromyces radiatus]